MNTISATGTYATVGHPPATRKKRALMTSSEREIYLQENRVRAKRWRERLKKTDPKRLATLEAKWRSASKLQLIKWRIARKLHIDAYRKNNRDRELANRRKRTKQRRLTDMAFAIECRLRSRFNIELRRRSIIKSKSILSLVGCSLADLMVYLADRMPKNMTKNDLLDGQRVHIDHIVPCSKFNLTLPEEQKRCFHYSNLQPLWAFDNIKKHNHI